MSSEVTFFLMVFFVAVIVFSAVYFIVKTLGDNNSNVIKHGGKTALSKSKITQYLPNFDEDRFNDNVFKKFVFIQQAMNNFNIENLKDNLSVELFQKYNDILSQNQQKGLTLIRNDFTHFYTTMLDITESNGKVIAKVLLGLEYKEYYLNSSNSVVSGSLEKPVSMEYNLLLYIKNNNRSIISCPYCGALVNDRVSPKCSYCKKSIISYDYDMIILKELNRPIRKPKMFVGEG